MEEGNMKKMNANDLSARINKFLDAKKPRMFELSDISDRKVRRTHRQHIEVSDTPFIALAIR